MPLFACSKCGAVENTGFGNFWCLDVQDALCSECDTGKWHGRFKKINAKEKGFYKDENGFIYSPEEVDEKTMEWIYNKAFKIIGKV